MIKYASFRAFLWLLAAPLALAQQAGTTAGVRVELGRLANSAAVAFVRAGSGDWGIEISGSTALRVTQPKPAQIEVHAGGENARQLAAGYQSVKKEGGTVVATAKVADEGQAAFAVEDQWKVSSAGLSLSRKVSVTGNPNIADKESGMLSMEAFLAVYDATKEPKWLQRAETAASYTESWIWIWNVPMPLDADDARLHWKKGVPTIGVNGIGSDVAGHVDQFLDWAVPCYAELYKLTRDEHYLDVARVLLHGTKAMLALPGRTYDVLGPGWQQEHWRMGPGTGGMGAHRDWLP